MATAFDNINTIENDNANDNANDEIQPVPQEGEIVEEEEYLDTETDTDDEDYVPEEESTGSNEDNAETTDEETDDEDAEHEKIKKTPVPRREFWTSEKLILCAGLALGIVNIAPHVPDALEWWCRRVIF